MASREKRPIASNKKAFHDYFVEDKYEAGISLAGTEVKSIRQGGVNLKDSFCSVKDGELIVRGLRISPYEKGNNMISKHYSQTLPYPIDLIRLTIATEIIQAVSKETT